MLRIAFLDDGAWMGELLDRAGIEYVFVYDMSREPTWAYDKREDRALDRSVHALETIRGGFEAVREGCDLIVIGNNSGAGLDKARALLNLKDPTVLERTIIVWTGGPRPGDTTPYEQLGYRHFGNRAAFASMRELIAQITN